MPKQALIAGGGIGGLAAAIALGRRGISCEILERSDFAEETGAGIQLGPNATRALAALGLLDAIESRAFKPDAIVIYDGVSGRKLSSLPLAKMAVARYGAPYLTLRRADLHAGLRAALNDLGSVTLRSGFDLAAIYAQAGDDVVARGRDGSHARGACLIGADGLWSAVRAIISPAAALRFVGATAWRAQLQRANLPAPFAEPVVGLWLGPRAHLVHYPVGGGADLNIVAVTAGGVTASSAARQGWNEPGSKADVLASFARWTKDAKSLLDQAEAWRGWSLYRLAGLKSWTAGPVTLLGDAAHPVLPYLAQGAGLAIEDAAALAACLAAEPSDPVSAFRRYERVRKPRAARVQRTARRFGLLYHLGVPLAQARNLILARRSEATALRRFDWLYRRDEPE
jgi:2-polyprenyl-6-methoxyphenol hydroxylase-like FAD-dependent oxidoreductase